MLFENFGGRNRESIRVLDLMRSTGVFKELPSDTVRFIQENYHTDVPYHNRIHILYGLLWLHHKGAPLLAKLAWIGHDAGHNGIKEESPEVQSAFLTWQWLKNHRTWLAENDGIDPQDGTLIIDATRFPYVEGVEPGEMIQWVRWADVIRNVSGDTAPYLDTNTNRFCTYFFESSQLFREMCPGRSDFIAWYPNAQISFTTYLRKMMNSWNLGGYYVQNRPNMIEGFNEVEGFIVRLCNTEEGKTSLLRTYNFLSRDVTYPEFVDFFSPHIHSLGR